MKYASGAVSPACDAMNGSVSRMAVAGAVWEIPCIKIPEEPDRTRAETSGAGFAGSPRFLCSLPRSSWAPWACRHVKNRGAGRLKELDRGLGTPARFHAARGGGETSEA